MAAAEAVAVANPRLTDSGEAAVAWRAAETAGRRAPVVAAEAGASADRAVRNIGAILAGWEGGLCVLENWSGREIIWIGFLWIATTDNTLDTPRFKYPTGPARSSPFSGFYRRSGRQSKGCEPQSATLTAANIALVVARSRC